MNGNGKIPFLDLVALHSELEGFIGGPMVEGFEQEPLFRLWPAACTNKDIHMKGV